MLDTLLDRTIAPGYSRLGYRLRRRGWDPLPRMDGQVVLVTGAGSGIGLAAAAGFARLGASVRLLVRDAAKGERARVRVGGDAAVVLCDLSRLDDVRRFAAGFEAAEPRLDVLVNNAGMLPPARRLTADGIELGFATNVVGPFLLTSLLVPLLERSAPARIVNVSSGGMYAQRLDLANLQAEHGDFSGTTVYARNKRAQVVLTGEWARRLAGTGVVAHAMHPGWADTPGLESSLPSFRRFARRLLRTPAEGADTIVWLGAAAEPARSSGGFWHDRRERPEHLVPWTRESVDDRSQLWAEVERLSRSSPTPE
jgi:dehydrogenase/reductase SDR family member 12